VPFLTEIYGSGSTDDLENETEIASMDAYSLASGILAFGFFFEGLSMNSAIALLLGCGVAEALSLGQRLVTGHKDSHQG
jgi:hypothetical protein